MPRFNIYVTARLDGDHLILRRCQECGALAATNNDGVVATNAQGRLPRECREQHGNNSIEQRLALTEEEHRG